MANTRWREPDNSATGPFHIVHIDLAGPIEPMARERFKYVLICVDSFSNLSSVYSIKQTSDTIHAMKKYLADIAPLESVKCIRSD